MSRFVSLLVAVGALVVGIPLSASAQTFVSGTGTAVSNASNTPIGNAQNVCLNGSSPSPCPAGATLWGYPGGGWGQSLAAIPGATWIWAPALTGASPASLAQYTFTKTVVVSGTPTAGTVYMLADDYVELRVNGSLAGSVGSISNPALSGGAQSALAQFNVLPWLVTGTNTFAFTAQNGPDSFSGVSNATYAQNPAAVVFGGSITAAPPVPVMGGWLTLALALVVAALVARRLRTA